MLLAWGLVAHNSGAGWVQAVGDALAGILGVGLVGSGGRRGPRQGWRSSRPRATGPPASRGAAGDVVHPRCGSGRSTRPAPRRSSGRTGHRRAPGRTPHSETASPPERAAGRGAGHAAARRPRRATTASCSRSPPRPLRVVVVAQDRRRRTRPYAARGTAPGSASAPAPGTARTPPAAGSSTRRSRSASPAACALPARGPPTLGALARHGPQRGADGARDGGPDRRARHLGDPPARRHRRRRAAGGAGHGDGRRARRPGSVGAPGHDRGRRARGSGPSATAAAPAVAWRAPWASPTGLSPPPRRARREIHEPLRAVKRANRPGPPEHSVTLRVACAGAVITGIAACRAEGELSWTVAGGSITLVMVGMVLAYRTRERPLPWIKPILALSAVAAFVWFFRQLTGQTIYDVSTVENPLAVLFVWVQVAHAFDVPARRDLAFSLAGSASLMAVAAAQAIDLAFGVYVVAVVGLRAGGARRHVGIGQRRGAPPGRWCARRSGICGRDRHRGPRRPARPARGGAHRLPLRRRAPAPRYPVPGGLAGDGKVAQLAKPGTTAGATRVGGYLGFSNRLDTALRGALGDTVVMRVRADRPSYWIGETFDTWDGANWTATPTPRSSVAPAGRLTVHPPRPDTRPGDSGDRPPDVLCRAVVAQPGVPRRHRPRGVVPDPRPLRLGPRLHRLPHRPGPGSDLHGGVVRDTHRRRTSSALRPTPSRGAGVDPAPTPRSPTPIPRAQALAAVGHRRRHDHLRQGAEPHRLDRQAHPLLHRHPSARGRARTPSTSSSSGTAPASASRSPPRWR